MAVNNGAVLARASSASDKLRPRDGTGTPLTPVPTRAVPGWNERIRRWAEVA